MNVISPDGSLEFRVELLKLACFVNAMRHVPGTLRTIHLEHIF